MTEYNDMGQRIAKLEEVAKGTSRRLGKLETDNEALIELKTIVKMQADFQERVHIDQKEQMDEFGNVLRKVNSNLTKLNGSSEQLRGELDSIGSRVGHIENAREANQIDPNTIVKNIILGISMIIVGLISGWIYSAVGLK